MPGEIAAPRRGKKKDGRRCIMPQEDRIALLQAHY
jgi:hypothetical protein